MPTMFILFMILSSVTTLWQGGDECEVPDYCYLDKEIRNCKSAKDCCDLDSAVWLRREKRRVAADLNHPYRTGSLRIPYEANQDPYVESFNTFHTVLGDHNPDNHRDERARGIHFDRLHRHERVLQAFPEYIGKHVVITD